MSKISFKELIDRDFDLYHGHITRERMDLLGLFYYVYTHSQLECIDSDFEPEALEHLLLLIAYYPNTPNPSDLIESCLTM